MTQHMDLPAMGRSSPPRFRPQARPDIRSPSPATASAQFPKTLKMFVLIDNYDSFTYNLFHFLGELGAAVEVHRNDQVSVAEVMGTHPQGIIFSPGPCDPDRAGICLELIK